MYRTPLTTLVTAALLTLAAPLALAGHEDPLHGLAPHGASTDPLNLHAVKISTPHPYPLGEVYEYTVRVEGAATLAVHFERYDVNGYYSSWDGVCYGSALRIYDGNTGLELDAFCGSQAADWWTSDYPTDLLVLRFETEGWDSGNYGFDVYEVASDGARPVASVPYSETPSAGASPSIGLAADPYNPAASTFSYWLHLGASWGATGVQQSGQGGIGTFYECSLICEEVEGFLVKEQVTIKVLGKGAYLSAALVGQRDGSAPGGYTVGEPSTDFGLILG